MIFNPILQKFSEKSPVTVMIQGLLERLLDLLRHKSSKNAEFENITDSKFFRFQLSH